LLKRSAIRNRWHGVFLSLYLFTMIVICLRAEGLMERFGTEENAGPILLFLGVFTFVNAPFDWASLGLTRALLRRGLELGGWWPYFLGLIDAVLGVGIVWSLALATVVSVKAFDHMAMFHQPGEEILPLRFLFNGIAENPGAPEYWWVYALLLSSMIPSLLNLMIGGASFIRSVPGLPPLLLRFIPAGKAVLAHDRKWLALVLTSQVFVGALLGVAAQAFLVIVVIFHLLPWFGLGLLGMASDVAEFDLPLRVLKLFWGES
jgi:hypothetical protein